MKVSIISGICVDKDAISTSVLDDAEAFNEQGYESTIFAYRVDLPFARSKQVNEINGILFDRFFADSDLIVYHFGVFYELFNIILVGNGRAKQVVRYHNITPTKLLPKKNWPTINRSIGQLQNFHKADRVWPVSEENRLDLLDRGFRSDAIEVIPLAVHDGARKATFLDKDMDVARFLFLGRLVESKGVEDLVQAIARLGQSEGLDRLGVTIMGSSRFSDPAYIARVHALIAAHDLGDVVVIRLDEDDNAVRNEMRRAHSLVIPSYHEGFCKPIVEAMYYGCIPISYEAYNLKFVADGLSKLVPTGDVAALAESIAAVRASVRQFRQKTAETPSITVERGVLTLERYEMAVDALLDAYSKPSVASTLRRAARDITAKP